MTQNHNSQYNSVASENLLATYPLMLCVCVRERERERERERLNKWIEGPEWTVLTLLLTVGEPKRITAIITRSISSNGKKRQHTKTRARTSVSREPVNVAVSCSIKRHFYLMLILADSLSNKYENRRGSQFGADVQKY